MPSQRLLPSTTSHKTHCNNNIISVPSSSTMTCSKLAKVLCRAKSISTNTAPSSKTGELTGKASVHKAGATDAKATKKRSWKKPKDKPKRPLSAYNLFFQSERNKIISAPSPGNNSEVSEKTPSDQALKPGARKRRRHRKSHGKIGFADLAKTIAEKWKKLDSQSKAVFEVKADAEKVRYKRELGIWAKEQEAKKAAVAPVDSSGQAPLPPVDNKSSKTPASPLPRQPNSDCSFLPSHQTEYASPQASWGQQTRRPVANPAVVAKLSLDECLAMTKRTLMMANAVLTSGLDPCDDSGSGASCEEPYGPLKRDNLGPVFYKNRGPFMDWPDGEAAPKPDTLPNFMTSHHNMSLPKSLPPIPSGGFKGQRSPFNFRRQMLGHASMAQPFEVTSDMEQLPLNFELPLSNDDRLAGALSSLDELDATKDAEVMDFLSEFENHATCV